MSPIREEFVIQIDRDLLSKLRRLAVDQGCEVDDLVEVAVVAWLDKHRHGEPNPEVMAIYHKSHARFAPMYQKLAEWN